MENREVKIISQGLVRPNGMQCEQYVLGMEDYQKRMPHTRSSFLQRHFFRIMQPKEPETTPPRIGFLKGLSLMEINSGRAIGWTLGGLAAGAFILDTVHRVADLMARR